MSWISIPTPCVLILLPDGQEKRFWTYSCIKRVLVAQDRNASYLLSKIYTAQQWGSSRGWNTRIYEQIQECLNLCPCFTFDHLFPITIGSGLDPQRCLHSGFLLSTARPDSFVVTPSTEFNVQVSCAVCRQKQPPAERQLWAKCTGKF